MGEILIVKKLNAAIMPHIVKTVKILNNMPEINPPEIE